MRAAILVALVLLPSGALAQVPDSSYLEPSALARMMAYQGERRDPGTAALLSAVFPGGGHFYNHKIGDGVVFLMLTTSAIIMAVEAEEQYDTVFPWLGVLFIALWDSYHAGQSAKAINRELCSKYGIKMDVSQAQDPSVYLTYRF